MSTMPFDPYHKWLGIPPVEQPPDHYRLLGVQRFESDLDVIESGADRQTIALRMFQIGPNAEIAARLLNEVSEARLCLLRPGEKKEYDQTLAALPNPAKVPTPPELPVPPPVLQRWPLLPPPVAVPTLQAAVVAAPADLSEFTLRTRSPIGERLRQSRGQRNRSRRRSR
jgi:hypothetical protein